MPPNTACTGQKMVHAVSGLPSASENGSRQKTFPALRHLLPVTPTVGRHGPFLLLHFRRLVQQLACSARKHFLIRLRALIGSSQQTFCPTLYFASQRTRRKFPNFVVARGANLCLLSVVPCPPVCYSVLGFGWFGAPGLPVSPLSGVCSVW